MAKFKNIGFKDDQQGLGNFEAIPAGTYVGKVIDSDLVIPKGKKKGDEMQVFIWEVLKGDYKGRKIWSRVNFQNDNPTTVDMANGLLINMCYAMGIKPSKYGNTTQMHGVPCEIKVSVETDEKGKYDPSNDIKNVFPLGKKSKADKADDSGKGKGKDKGKKGKKGKDKKPGWSKK